MSAYVKKRAIRYKFKQKEINEFSALLLKDEYDSFVEMVSKHYNLKEEYDLKEGEKAFVISGGYNSSTKKYEYFIDYLLEYLYDADGYYETARDLTIEEYNVYLPIFRRKFPTLEINDLHYVDYSYYNGADEPSVYEICSLITEVEPTLLIATNKCARCNKEIPNYLELCGECEEKVRYNTARKMTYEEYKKNNKESMVYYNDVYYNDLEECIETLREQNKELPEYVYGTIKYRVEIDGESALDDAECNADLEDFSFDEVGKEEFLTFIKKWNQTYGVDAFCQDDKTVILLHVEEV